MELVSRGLKKIGFYMELELTVYRWIGHLWSRAPYASGVINLLKNKVTIICTHP